MEPDDDDEKRGVGGTEKTGASRIVTGKEKRTCLILRERGPDEDSEERLKGLVPEVGIDMATGNEV